MVDETNIPIVRRTLDLYKEAYIMRASVSKQNRFTIWQRVEQNILDILEFLLTASALPKSEKKPELEKMSNKLNVLRMLIRLSHEVRAIDNKKYIRLQQIIDEIGRMLGGWIKSLSQQR